MKKPAFMQNITKKMVAIWAVSFVGLLVIIFGTTLIVLVSVPKTYGVKLNYDNIVQIEYMNANTTTPKQLYKKDNAVQTEQMTEILRLLNNGRKTNALMNIFQGNPEKYSVTTNDTRIDFSQNFKNTYSKNGLMIWFSTPQFNLTQSDRYTYDLNTGYDTTSRNNVYGILIPLDKTKSQQESQTWFLLTSDKNLASSDYITISCKMEFHASYKKLWDYVSKL